METSTVEGSRRSRIVWVKVSRGRGEGSWRGWGTAGGDEGMESVRQDGNLHGWLRFRGCRAGSEEECRFLMSRITRFVCIFEMTRIRHCQ